MNCSPEATQVIRLRQFFGRRAATMVYLLVTSAGAEAARLFGKAAWYLPYAALVGSIRFFRAA